jgi:hypothetical protein
MSEWLEMNRTNREYFREHPERYRSPSYADVAAAGVLVQGFQTMQIRPSGNDSMTPFPNSRNRL